MKLTLNAEQKTRLTEIAAILKDLPYVYGAEVKLAIEPEALKEAGHPFDCSELVQYIFYHIGFNVPDGANNQYNASGQLPDIGQADIGDLVFKEKDKIINHIGLVIGIGPHTIVEAEGWYKKVIIRPLAAFMKCNPGASQFAGLRRFNAEKIKTNV